MPSRCDQVEDYLTADLPDGAMADFAQHLRSCEDCTRIVAAAEEMKCVVRKASQDLESPSAALRDRVRRTMRQQSSVSVATFQQYRPLQVTALVIALGLLLAMSVLMLLPPGQNQVADSAPHESENHQPEISEMFRPPTIQLSDRNIGVPVESGDPNVTVLLVYDVVSSMNESR